MMLLVFSEGYHLCPTISSIMFQLRYIYTQMHICDKLSIFSTSRYKDIHYMAKRVRRLSNVETRKSSAIFNHICLGLE